jgi:hypothetical protein
MSPLASEIVKATGCPDWIAEGIAHLPPGGAGNWYEPDATYERGTDWRAEASHFGVRVVRTTRWHIGQSPGQDHQEGP